MLQHYLLLSFRTFKRFKSSFFINLLGLSTGLACALLIYLWVKDELAVDKFNEKDTRLYQVMQNFPTANALLTVEATPGILAQALLNEMPQVEDAAVTASPWRGGTKGIISLNDTRIKANELYVSNNFFSVFSYHLLEGEKEAVLKDKYSVLLSDELAFKLFHTTENIIGRTIEWTQGQFSGPYIVSGIFEKTPGNSSQQFDLLFNYQLFLDKQPHMQNWANNGPSTYLVLKEGTNLEVINVKIKDFIRAKFQVENGSNDLKWVGTLFLQRYSDKYLYNHYENGVQAGGRIDYVRLFSIIAIFIIAIACINFTNLSTAKASGRLKEIGIKKTVGADRKALILQFLSESMFLTFLSLIIALVLIVLLLPQFNQITGKELSLNPDMRLVLTILAITLLTGIIAGSYPALYLSGFKPIAVLKGKLNPSSGEAWARKGLVVFQFVISVILIVSVLVVYKQIDFIQFTNLGYSKENIIYFKKEGKLNEGLQTFLLEVKNIPGVLNASSMTGTVTGEHGGTPDLSWEGKSPEDKIQFEYLEVDNNLIELLGITLAQGRAFSKEFGRDSTKIIFNEKAIAAMGLKEPVGKTIKLWGKDRQIIGVVKDFHFESLYQQVKPLMLIPQAVNQNVLVKIKAAKQQETIEQIEKFYKTYNNGLSFEYTYLDEQYQAQYAAEQRVAILSRYFAGVTILISCLGLFGLAAFTAQRRRKEIGIRKVLGLSEVGIFVLLSREFIRIVLISILIALPISLLLTKEWLDSFAFQIDLAWWYFAIAGLAALLIAWFTVGMQAIKAARVNPIQSLKEE